MARSFLRASSQGARDTPISISAPFSIYLLVNPDDATSLHLVTELFDFSSALNFWRIDLRGDVAGDPARLLVNDGSGLVFADTGNSYTSGAWNSLCFRERSSTDRDLVLNADFGNKAANTDSRTPTGIDSLTIAEFHGGGFFLDADIAELYIFNVAITDDEVTSLDNGVRPGTVRPTDTFRGWPLWGLHSPEIDLTGASSITLTGTPPQANHAPVTPFTPKWAASALEVLEVVEGPEVIHSRVMISVP